MMITTFDDPLPSIFLHECPELSLVRKWHADLSGHLADVTRISLYLAVCVVHVAILQ